MIAQDLYRIAAQLEELQISSPTDLFIAAAERVKFTVGDGVSRYTFRDGSRIFQGTEDRWVGYPGRDCDCKVGEGHACGENDLPAFDPDAEVDFEEEQEMDR